MQLPHLARALLVTGALGAGASHAQPLAINMQPCCDTMWSRLGAGEEISVALIGDSMVNRVDSLNWTWRALMQNAYGVGGEGYRAFAPGFKGQNNSLLDPPRNGMFWTTGGDAYTPPNDAVRDPEWGLYAPDGRFTRLRNDGWMTADIYGRFATLHYLRIPGGGVMSFSIDGGEPELIPTDSPAVEWASHAIELPDALVHSLHFTSVDGAPLILLGLDMRTGEPGVTYHRIAQGGAGPDMFLFSATPQVAQMLGAIDPDLVIIMDDWTTSSGKDNYPAQMNTLLDFYEEAMPHASFILMSHHPFHPERKQQAIWLHEIASQRGLGFINLFDLFDGYLAMEARGLMQGSVHFSLAGGQWFGEYLFDLLHAPPGCYEACADWNMDCNISTDDFIELLGAYGEGDADANRDGQTNTDDFVWYLSRYGGGSCSY